MSHQIAPVTAETLHELDVGMFGSAIDRQIQTIIEDLQARPCDAAGKTHTRKLMIELDFKPEVTIDPNHRTAHVKKIDLEPSVWGVLPRTRGAVTDVRIVKGKAHFNRDCPNEFTQQSLDYGQEDFVEK